jgi:2-amino-4-hydroxy-6-hydroxymethyldihydropteridine diphosphokinase
LPTSHLHDYPDGHIIFLSLGANRGDRKNNIEQALQRLENIIAIQAVSSLYETEPVGEGGKPLRYDQEGDKTSNEEGGQPYDKEGDKTSNEEGGQPLTYFLNLACQGRTNLEPNKVLTALKEIEASMGRLPSFRNAPRPIDIDILLYDNLQISLPQLVIPHPRMRERAFVLIPLAEIAPLAIEPISGQTIQQLAANVATQGIHKLPS